MAEIIVEALVNNNGDAVWTPYLYTYEAETDFMIDPDNLDGEICGVGPMLTMYGDLHARLKAQEERHKRELERVSSKLYIEKRKALLISNEKATDALIKAEVTVDPEYQVAVENYVNTQKEATRADGWWKSVLKKADLLQALAYKISSEIKRGAY